MLRLLALAASFCITWLLPHPHPASWNSSPGHWDAVSQTWSPQNSHQRKHNSQLPGCDRCLSRQLQHPLFTVGQAAFFSLTKNTCGEGSGRSWTEGLCPCGVGVRYPLSTWTRSPARGTGIKPGSLALQVGSLPAELPGKPWASLFMIINKHYSSW